MKDFAAIDFETATGRRSSVCSVGIVIVRRGHVVDKFYSLIKPAPNYYMWFCQGVHGLDSVYSDTSIEADVVKITVIASGKEMPL